MDDTPTVGQWVVMRDLDEWLPAVVVAVNTDDGTLDVGVMYADRFAPDEFIFRRRRRITRGTAHHQWQWPYPPPQ